MDVPEPDYPTPNEQRIIDLEAKFQHYHVNNGDGTDACRECGFDLRDRVHIRAAINALPVVKTT